MVLKLTSEPIAQEVEPKLELLDLGNSFIVIIVQPLILKRVAGAFSNDFQRILSLFKPPFVSPISLPQLSA